ncbi:MAG: hypothetical protein L0323_15665 [Planctomycetes bacterium]|nr:hypothetical protein [Planctomycetota bacterium]
MPTPLSGLVFLGLPLLAAVAAPLGSQAESRPAEESSRPGIYSCVPDHPWELVHRALWVRTEPDGKEHGVDDLDPLLWPQSRYLLEEPAFSRAVSALDAFLATNAERLFPDPLKRVVLQRDLWAIFDWLASVSRESEPRAAELAKQIARAMRRVALSSEEIRSLPHNYDAAVASGAFPPGPTAGERSEPFLGPGLLDLDGSWVRLAQEGPEPLAPSHLHHVDGRSLFLVCLRLPGGREATVQYLRKLRDFPEPLVHEGERRRLNPSLPQFPPGTAVALLRRTLAIDDQGRLTTTPVTESVQVRLFRSIENPAPEFGCDGELFPFQEVFEFDLSRERLFAGVAGGLRAVGREEKRFARLGTHGNDPLERPFFPGQERGFPLLQRCGSCHAQPGIFSVNSFTRISTGPGTILDVEAREVPRRLHPAEPRFPEGYDFRWKEGRASFGYLRGLWAALPR